MVLIVKKPAAVVDDGMVFVEVEMADGEVHEGVLAGDGEVLVASRVEPDPEPVKTVKRRRGRPRKVRDEGS